MLRVAPGDSLQGRLGRRLSFASLLVLAVLLGHALIMASPRHAEGMAMGRGRAMGAAGIAPAVAALADDTAPAPAPGDRQPPPRWAGCSPQDGVLPTLLLLLIGAVLWWRAARTARLDTPARAGRRAARAARPPPLAPSRRRALLQVFRN